VAPAAIRRQSRDHPMREKPASLLGGKLSRLSLRSRPLQTVRFWATDGPLKNVPKRVR
jgi:hypothetical protein